MNDRILITGSEGLVGTALRKKLEEMGIEVGGLDLRGAGAERGDVRDSGDAQSAVAGCTGVVHLAAISRIVEAERNQDECRRTNVTGLHNIIEAAERQSKPPWVLFSSSREVYGQPEELPSTEDAPLNPVNAYGRSKLDGERIVHSARTRGLRTAVVRLSNVYGATRDHADRVIPAFARAAILGNPLRVEGSGHTFDFTHLDDTVRGILGIIELLHQDGAAPPPIHLLTGVPTTLSELAALAVRLGGKPTPIREAPPRSNDVSRFYGTPARAAELLNWTPRVGIVEGLGRLVEEFRLELDSKRSCLDLGEKIT